MAVTRNRIGASGRLNQNVRPKDSRRNLHRSYLGNRNAFLVAAKQTPLHAAHAQWANHDARREPQISLGPAARGEGLIGTSRNWTRRNWTRRNWTRRNWTRRIWTCRTYTHSSAPFFQIHT